MKKVLILSSFPAPYRVDVFKGIAQEYEVDVIFDTDKDQNRSKNFFTDKKEFKYYINSCESDRRIIKEKISDLKKYFVVLAYDWYLPYALKIEEKCIREGIPYIINCDGAFLPQNTSIKDKIKNIIKRRYICHAYRCFASGKYAAAYFEYYGAEKQRIIIHPFSSLHKQDMDEISGTETEKSTLKKKIGLEDKKTVISVGQFIFRKGFDILLNAWRELDDLYQLVLIGGGEERELYDRIIQEHKYVNVHLVDFLPKEKIIEYYKASDVFALATREDIWGLVIIEALACGLPIVSTNMCVAACEMIDNGAYGSVVEVENADALHDALLKELEKTYEVESVAEIVRSYTIENIVESHLKVLEKLKET